MVQTGYRGIYKCSIHTILVNTLVGYGINEDEAIEVEDTEKAKEILIENGINDEEATEIINSITCKNVSSTGTEGIGLYIASTKELAQFFTYGSGEVHEVKYNDLSSTLVVDEETLYLLNIEDNKVIEDLFSKIESYDSEWTIINKLAVKESGINEKDIKIDTDNSVYQIEVALTNIIRREGYDSVSVTSGGETWYVLFSPVILSDKLLYKV